MTVRVTKMRSSVRSQGKLKRSTSLCYVARTSESGYVSASRTHSISAYIVEFVAVNNLSIIYSNLDLGQKME